MRTIIAFIVLFPVSALADGAPGPTGITGNSGQRGEHGAPGPTGEQGDRGPKGVLGVKGQTGAAGVQGPRGAIGPAGSAGVPGWRGNTGTTGVPGPQGPVGPPSLDEQKLWKAYVNLGAGESCGSFCRDKAQRDRVGWSYACVGARYSSTYVSCEHEWAVPVSGAYCACWMVTN